MMGTEYSVACKDCKVVRDLDKFYTSDLHDVGTRQQALDYRGEIEKDSFRAGLLVSFMAKHKGHNCVFFDEHSECSDELDPYWPSNDYTEDTNFWKEAKIIND